MPLSPLLLGIESSCDDTAAAVVANGQLLSSIVASQLEHSQYGGVVPEVASRAHQRTIVPVVAAALEQAGVGREDLNAVAVTYGPGLAGALLVGLSFAKAYSLALGIPLVGVNHLEGHLYSVFLEETAPAFPFLCLIVSGGHTQLVLVEDGFKHTTLGRTRDDAAGEAYDKVAKLMGLGYPGGPALDNLAAAGDPTFATLPRTYLPDGSFSFSGVKTAVRYFLEAQPNREAFLASHKADLAASFQAAVVDMLLKPLGRAVRKTGVRDVAIVGGVSANRGLRARAQTMADTHGFRLHVPALQHCTDNAAMIAMTGFFRYQSGQSSPLTLAAQPALSFG